MAKKISKEENVAATPEAPKASKKVDFPEVAGNGRFQAVAVDGGFVVYNPNGQRATGVISDAKARDIVTMNNTGAGIK